MEEYSIVEDDVQKKYIKPNHEIRIDFVSVLLDNYMVVPLYYYSYKQECSYSYNLCIMDSDKLKEIDKDILHLLVDDVQKETSAKAIALSYSNNLHTHPVGMTYFSSEDAFDGMLTNDFVKPDDKDFCGVNMLYSFKGDFYQTLLRKRKRGEYEYEEITRTITLDFEPYDSINIEDFNEVDKITDGEKHVKCMY